ncbi:hypothetical protein [Exiguobacterium antarcticum]|uniref:hypothetical protein n=1 Tax=Exiguobacterium antarcticum TaxID=132920 RepID=UPI0004790CC6|nr:hypothetical protein [Exiguobacterium antarcticum]
MDERTRFDVEIGKKYQVICQSIYTATGQLLETGVFFEVISVSTTDYVKVKFLKDGREKITLFHISKMNDDSVFQTDESVGLNTKIRRPLLEHVAMAGEKETFSSESPTWRLHCFTNAKDDINFIERELDVLYTWSEQHELHTDHYGEKAYDQSVQQALIERYQNLRK